MKEKKQESKGNEDDASEVIGGRGFKPPKKDMKSIFGKVEPTEENK